MAFEHAREQMRHGVAAKIGREVGQADAVVPIALPGRKVRRRGKFVVGKQIGAAGLQ